jgi:hypothetical protein
VFFQIAFGFFAPASEGKDALCRNGNVFLWDVATRFDIELSFIFL